MSASRHFGQPAWAQAKLATPGEWQPVKIAIAVPPFRVWNVAIPIILLEGAAICLQLPVNLELADRFF
jgi:hypothetical protein